MSNKPVATEQRIKQQQATIVAYYKEVEKLRADNLFLRQQLLNTLGVKK